MTEKKEIVMHWNWFFSEFKDFHLHVELLCHHLVYQWQQWLPGSYVLHVMQRLKVMLIHVLHTSCLLLTACLFALKWVLTHILSDVKNLKIICWILVEAFKMTQFLIKNTDECSTHEVYAIWNLIYTFLGLERKPHLQGIILKYYLTTLSFILCLKQSTRFES